MIKFVTAIGLALLMTAAAAWIGAAKAPAPANVRPALEAGGCGCPKGYVCCLTCQGGTVCARSHAFCPECPAP
jgi:hypothetical protein